MDFDYRKLADTLTELIEEGIYVPGSIIPSERDLCLKYETSRTTVRRAIDDLVGNGILVKKPGKGTFVTEKPVQSSQQTGTVLFLRCMHSQLKFDSFLTDDVFYPNVLSGIEIGAERKGYLCLVKTINEKDKNWDSLKALNGKIDGIICGELHDPLFLEHLMDLGLPLVLVSPSVDAINTDTVIIDNSNGTQFSTEQLIARGHRKIAFIGGSVNSLPAVERKAGYRKAMERAGLRIDPDYVIDTNWLQSDGYSFMNQLLDLNERPSAVVAASDLLAIGVCNAARERGLSIPGDLSVIGFDGIFTARQYKPALSTMYVRAMAMGDTAFRLFYEQLGGKRSYPIKIAIPTEFMEGETITTFQ
ncbi:MAG: GntR family transcriptional regulator [Spirochaetales bacterium]|nr:GntR family transcriptional regulator [Spirochaetales bacterium]